MAKIMDVENLEQIKDARILFIEYQKWFGFDLCFQNFDEEVANLPDKYVKPHGRLFLAYADGSAAGCIALKKLDDESCEMKRLFVRENFRGKRIGVSLIERFLHEAAIIGYLKIRLETHPPKMSKALKLYESFGFREIPPYSDNPYSETLFMEKQLNKDLVHSGKIYEKIV